MVGSGHAPVVAVLLRASQEPVGSLAGVVVGVSAALTSGSLRLRINHRADVRALSTVTGGASISSQRAK
jgi:hypothetical protein